MEVDRNAVRRLLEPERLIKPSNLLAYIKENQIIHGMYGWWFDYSLPDVPRVGCLELEDKHLLYIGIAPPKSQPTRSGSATPMKSRLWRNHLRGSVRSSTLRLSLAALLKHELDLGFYRDSGGRVRMIKEHEDKLTTWIKNHAGVSVEQNNTPWQLEEALVSNGPPLPLNLSMSHHPFRPTLSGLRTALGRD
ncbi:hypothetical protein GV827_22430 [Sulfitobacter sp. JBTF-M27]|uniref:GIY-YIG catalytic domain-containing protein n=1 Tax=Sulfitobacter sediminilitoris TaxID=2698830 RepID=A0A6P0CGR6_9RHOB|nr:hypothetical protein [Sulfitobacter sediminilitoris]NEK25127.1 hypothetical protein [Sulfitobacter sediminilitoris]